MLTQQQRDTFRLALASWNKSSATVEELDISDMIEDDQVVSTGESIDHFFSSRGRKLNRNGERPETPYELNRTKVGDLYIWEDQQSRKGARRGTLFVMNFGDYSACYFDGEA